MVEKLKADFNVRSYALTGLASVGSILRFGNITVVVADIRRWKFSDGTPYGREVFAMSRLRGIIGENRTLRCPHVDEQQEHASGQTVETQKLPVVRFPAWLHCPNPDCGHLSFLPWKSQGLSQLDEVRCPKCESGKAPRLKPAPWVVASSTGLLTEFPWQFYAHRDAGKPSGRCEHKDELYLTRNMYGKEVLKCRACNAPQVALEELEKVPMEPWVKYSSWQPWDLTLKYSDAMQKLGRSNHSHESRAMRLTDLRIHSAVTTSAVDIPPESRVTPNDLRHRIHQHADYMTWKKIKDPVQLQKRLGVKSREWDIPYEDIRAAWDDLEAGWPENLEDINIPATTIELRVQEYNAFLTNWGKMNDEERFIVRDYSQPWADYVRATGDSDGNLIDRVIAVDRLREVRAFKGFRRLSGEVIIDPDLTGEEDWTPAVELYGEGIFFSIRESALEEWEAMPDVSERVLLIRKRFGDNPLPNVAELLGGVEEDESASYITPRFIMLHTLAHLMIRQLEFMAGVSAASIRERIYSSTDPKLGTMAGILLYTTSADQVGSLAGLSVLAEPRSFGRMLRAAIDHGRWCSFDPVCAEHEGSGPGSLNRAACHGCALLPEPSCEFFNSLLDRTLVVSGHGIDSISRGFFGRNQG